MRFRLMWPGVSFQGFTVLGWRERAAEKERERASESYVMGRSDSKCLGIVDSTSCSEQCSYDLTDGAHFFWCRTSDAPKARDMLVAMRTYRTLQEYLLMGRGPKYS